MWNRWLPNERYVKKPGRNLNRLKINIHYMWPRRKYAHMCWQPKSPSNKNSLLIFKVNLAGRTVSGLLDIWLEREEMSSVCAV